MMNKLIKQAFTLIELLVVIAIIGILSGLIVVTMSGVTSKANIAKAQVFSNSLKNSLMLNLITEYKLDEASGTSIADSWGGHDGTLTGTLTSFSDCIYGKCISFNGSTHISVSDNDIFNFGFKMTAMVWVKTVATGSDKSIFSQANLNTNNSWIIATNGGLLRVYLYSDGTNNRVYTSNSVSDGNWHLVGFTWNTGTASLYIDGQPVSATPTGATLTNSLFDSTSSLCIGCYYNNNLPTAYFVGQIDEARLYNTVIPTSQIKEQYYAGLNKLLINGGIDREEYAQRIREMASY